ncbi:hypothetical protein BJ165DRAFT_229699 [Panaeolus papilionaceus]|nr:hypothetical protein BJ165DRAFT_229699 [Panaeolus papilionaceus]
MRITNKGLRARSAAHSLFPFWLLSSLCNFALTLLKRSGLSPFGGLVDIPARSLSFCIGFTQTLSRIKDYVHDEIRGFNRALFMSSLESIYLPHRSNTLARLTIHPVSHPVPVYPNRHHDQPENGLWRQSRSNPRPSSSAWR